jgi:hypothetical protein
MTMMMMMAAVRPDSEGTPVNVGGRKAHRLEIKSNYFALARPSGCRRVDVMIRYVDHGPGERLNQPVKAAKVKFRTERVSRGRESFRAWTL